MPDGGSKRPQIAWLNDRAVAAGGSGLELAALAAVAAVAAVAGRSLEIMRPVAYALVAALAWGLAEQGLRHRRVRASRVVRSLRVVTPPLLLFATSVWMLWPIWKGDESAFLDQDNATHVERARLFWQELSHGRWPHWTNLMEGGEPLTDAYGWLGNLIPPFIRLLTWGRLTFDRAYVWTLCSLHGLSAVAVYALSRRFARRDTAFVSGLLFIVGGHLVPYLTGDRPIWHLHLHMGLWHSFFAATLAMFATAKLVDVVRRGRIGDVIALTLLVTASCLAHGFGSLSILTLFGCTIVAGFLAPPASSRRTWLGVLALTIGLLMASAWVLPASRVLTEYGLRFPRPPHEDDQSLLEFIGPLSTATLLAGGVASIVALFHRDRLLRGVAMAGLATILLDEAGIVSQLWLADSPAGRAMQWHRATLLFVFASTAPFAVMLDRMLDRRRAASLSFRTVVARAIGIGVVFVFVLGPLGTTITRGRYALRKIEVVKYEDEPEYRLLEVALQRLRANDRDAYRGYFAARANPHAAMALALRTGVPLIAMNNPPGLFLMNRPQIGDLDGVRAWAAKYFIVDATATVSANWKEVERVGRYRIYRDDGFLGMARGPKGVTVTTTRFDDREIRLRVAGAPPGGADVQLAVAYYPRFRAFQNGLPLTIEAAPSRTDGPNDQLKVHAVDGEVVFHPNGSLPSSARAWTGTFVGIGLFGLLLAARFSSGFRARLSRGEARRRALVDRLRAAATPRRSAAAMAISLAVFVLGTALPRAPSARPRLRAFFEDRFGVRRNDVACPQSWGTRKWICGDPNESQAEVQHTVSSEPAPGFWPQGDSWSSLRIVEREGKSNIRVRFRRMQLSRWVHVRMAPHDDLPSAIGLRVGNGQLIPVTVKHGWMTVDTGVTGVADVYLELTFLTRGGLEAALWSDGSSEAPKIPKQ